MSAGTAFGAAAGGALGNSQTTIPLDATRTRPMANRAARYSLRRALRRVTRVKRIRNCGKPIGQAVGVKYSTGHGAGFSNRETCGSVYSCPECSAKIAARRALELDHVLGWADREGFTVAMVTLTVRHTKRDRLRDVWDAVAKGWNAATTSRAWGTAQRLADFQGWVSAVETTVGDNGWHVHRHVVLVYRNAEHGAHLGDVLWDGWLRGIERQGFTALRDFGGFDMTISNGNATGLGSYLAKQATHGAPDLAGLAREATHGMSKSGRKGGRSPFEVLAWAITTGDADDLALWHEWEKYSRGRRFMGWSGRGGVKCLRTASGLGREKKDEEVAEESPDGEACLVLPRGTYLALERIGGECTVLELVEQHEGDVSVACAWLDLLGLSWSLPGDDLDLADLEPERAAAPAPPPRSSDASWSTGWHGSSLEDDPDDPRGWTREAALARLVGRS